MALLTRNISILAKIESTYGQDTSPGASNGLYVIGSAPKIIQEPNELNDVVGRGSLSKLPASQPGPRHWQCDFRVPVRGAGAAYSSSVVPRISSLLRACGLQETIVDTPGVETVTYVPRSENFESINLYYNWDGLLYKMLGTRGSVNFVVRTGGILFAEFTFQGLYVQPTDSALVTVTGEPTVQFPVLLSGAFQIGSENYAAPFQNWNLNMSGVLVADPDPSAADGISQIYLVNRQPEGSFDPTAVLVATFDWYSKWKAGTIMDMSFTHGTTQYNKIAFTMSQVQSKDVTPGDRGQLGMFTTPYRVVDNSAAGDSEVSIVFS
jgi:hypothetical protein